MDAVLVMSESLPPQPVLPNALIVPRVPTRMTRRVQLHVKNAILANTQVQRDRRLVWIVWLARTTL